MINTAKSDIDMYAGALGSSLAPVLANGVHSQLASSISQPEDIKWTPETGVVYLPVADAAKFFRRDAALMRDVLEQMKVLREKNGGGILFPVDAYSKLVRAAREHAQFIFELKSAIRMALQDAGSQGERRALLIDFGKAVASMEFSLQDVLLAYSYAKKPEKTLNTTT
ncbi:hypothetical protein O4O00_16595 [Citrobacter sedlakii]|uniref:hypothetical protein n=1 Tax=Citrobacter sedlakii TaxID=67826 RepID=UPI0022B3A7C3|nr:hypothetical protein [Citrobacter sedlakii]MCZ4675999.1 hypothetical protein [Citrobacter sedlakii]MDR5006054.1 hypothetical protein [Citrobacter sedlakii]